MSMLCKTRYRFIAVNKCFLSFNCFLIILSELLVVDPHGVKPQGSLSIVVNCAKLRYAMETLLSKLIHGMFMEHILVGNLEIINLCSNLY
jgi:hypothetical protein